MSSRQLLSASALYGWIQLRALVSSLWDELRFKDARRILDLGTPAIEMELSACAAQLSTGFTQGCAFVVAVSTSQYEIASRDEALTSSVKRHDLENFRR